MKTITGDLIALACAGKFDVIVHGCNCFHMMGAGIARQIRAAFPEAYMADRKTAFGSSMKLGTLSVANVERAGHTFSVVNAYTQCEGGANLDMAALQMCFATVARRFHKKRIGYPKIGAGIAGGDWDEITPIIDRELAGEDHTLVVLEVSK